MDRKNLAVMLFALLLGLLMYILIVFDSTVEFKILLSSYLIGLFLAITTYTDILRDRIRAGYANAYLFMLLVVFGMFSYFVLGMEVFGSAMLIAAVLGYSL